MSILEMKVPSPGESIKEVEIATWLVKTGDYVEDGYYFYSDSFAQQTTADREARKSMPVNIALKYSGFMHSADILITLNQ